MNFAGNYLLARTFADQVALRLPDSITTRRKEVWASPELCDRRLAVTVWDRYRVWQDIRSRIAQPPFTQKLDSVALVKMLNADLENIKSRAATQTPAEAREIYEQALALTPDDSLLHSHFARFLEDGGFLAEAIEECRRVIKLQPHRPGLY